MNRRANGHLKRFKNFHQQERNNCQSVPPQKKKKSYSIPPGLPPGRVEQREGRLPQVAVALGLLVDESRHRALCARRSRRRLGETNARHIFSRSLGLK